MAIEVLSITQVIDNLRAEVIAQQVAVLRRLYPDRNLVPFTKFYRSYVGHFLKDYPHLYVVRVRPSFREDDFDVLVTLDILIEGEIEARGPATATAEALMVDVMRYWSALDSIIRNISMDALLQGAENVTNVDKARVIVNDWDTIPLDGGPVGPTDPQAVFINAPQMSIQIQYWERANG